MSLRKWQEIQILLWQININLMFSGALRFFNAPDFCYGNGTSRCSTEVEKTIRVLVRPKCCSSLIK